LWPSDSAFDEADYQDAFSADTAHALSRPPEQWARHVLEGASRPMRTFLRVGWRYALGFPLTKDDSVLGWPVVAESDGWVVLQQQSWVFGVALLMLVADGKLTWSTRVKYRSRVARPAWFLIGMIHRRFAPRALRRAVADAAR
jgi:hypothetical protein